MDEDFKEYSKHHKYTFEKLLGEGAFGQVWKAVNEDGQTVAIKRFKNVSERTLKDFVIEMNGLEAISKDPNFCRKYTVCLLDYYYVDRDPRIVFDFVQGKDLTALIDEIPLPARQQDEKIIKNLVVGLDRLHSLDVTHQDIKPDNIMLNDSGDYVYIDWGLSCLKRYCKGGGHACSYPCGTSGTPIYMPEELQPVFDEQSRTFVQYGINDFNISKAHDYWALGVTLLLWYIGENNEVIEKNVDIVADIQDEEIQNLINQTNNTLAMQVLPLLLERDPEKRLENWGKVVELIFDIDQCNPRDKWENYRGPSADVIVDASHAPYYYCLLKDKVIRQDTYDPDKNYIINPYTNEEFFIDPAIQEDLRNRFERSKSLTKTAEHYLESNFGRLFGSRCGTESLASFQQWLSDEWKYMNLLPFFLLITRKGLIEYGKKSIPPIKLSKIEHIVARMIFDKANPVATLAMVLQLIKSFVENNYEESKQTGIMCRYLNFLVNYVPSFQEFCNSRDFKEWNTITFGLDSEQLLKDLQQFIENESLPIPLAFLKANHDLDTILEAWVMTVDRDRKLEEICSKVLEQGESMEIEF